MKNMHVLGTVSAIISEYTYSTYFVCGPTEMLMPVDRVVRTFIVLFYGSGPDILIIL